ncbi:MAG: ribonuclease P protein component [Clostridia bacterium]|nr:ribonuclease P protein component [Clostridia bacterium]
MGKIFTIKQNGQFSRAFCKGINIVGKNIVVYALKCKNAKESKIGITVNKKLGDAVQRNRVKRLIKEAYRTLLQTEPKIVDEKYIFVFVARARCFNKKVKMQHIRRDIKNALEKLN